MGAVLTKTRSSVLMGAVLTKTRSSVLMGAVLTKTRSSVLMGAVLTKTAPGGRRSAPDAGAALKAEVPGASCGERPWTQAGDRPGTAFGRSGSQGHRTVGGSPQPAVGAVPTRKRGDHLPAGPGLPSTGTSSTGGACDRTRPADPLQAGTDHHRVWRHHLQPGPAGSRRGRRQASWLCQRRTFFLLSLNPSQPILFSLLAAFPPALARA
jgi:hypothetical protein